MRRLNFLDEEPWDEVHDYRRVRWFGHPFEADMLGASLIELLPRAPDEPLHMHYGVEEMFFVLTGTPTVRTPEGGERLTPGDVVYFPEGPDGLHDFSNPTDEPARILGISTKRFPDVLAYPERGVAWVATRHPERPLGEDADKGSSPGSSYPPNSQTCSSGDIRERSPKRQSSWLGQPSVNRRTSTTCARDSAGV